jgi:hypothetical protein
MEYGQTARNRSVYASAAYAAFGLRKPQPGLRAFVRTDFSPISPAHFARR